MINFSHTFVSSSTQTLLCLHLKTSSKNDYAFKGKVTQNTCLRKNTQVWNVSRTINNVKTLDNMSFKLEEILNISTSFPP